MLEEKGIGKAIFWLLVLIILTSFLYGDALPSVKATSDPIESWAIIVTGSDGTDTWYNGSMTAYNALLDMGYTDDSIYYLDVVNRTDGRFDNYTTKQNINSSISNWLATRSDGNDMCVILFNSHGGDTGGGYLILNYTEHLYYSEINQYLQSVEYGRLVIVVDACFSALAFDDLNATNRIVISSAKTTENAAPSTFSRHFWPKTLDMTIMDAFNIAANETLQEASMLPNPNPSEGEWPPHPQLDDNGDGVGHWRDYDPLPSRGDGYLAKATYLDASKMLNLHIFTKGTDGTELTNVDVTINVTTNEGDGSLFRQSPVHIILSQDSYTVEVEESVTQAGYTWNFAYWEDNSTSNVRVLTLSANKTITAYYEKAGGGCPYVYAWNGSAYVPDNNILAESELSNGTDVLDLYRLEQPMAPIYEDDDASLYSIMLAEFENEHSYIDQVKLLAVDHDPSVKVALTPEGQILTYAEPSPPVSAVDSYGNDVLSLLTAEDDIYYQGFIGDYVILDFGGLDVSKAAKLVVKANLEFKKDTCIHVQTLDETGEWADRAILRTRYNWSTQIVDLSQHLPDANGSLKVRLYFTGIHRIDYVGLDTTPQQDIEVYTAPPVLALHSEEGTVTLKLLENDQVYAELLPGQQIRIYFLLPNTNKTRTFIIYIEGHYQTIK